MTSKRDAKDAVLGISDAYGYIDDKTMNGIENPEVRRIIGKQMLAKDKMLAHSINTCVICLPWLAGT